MKTKLLLATLIASLLSGCVGWRDSQRVQATSVVQFLYPDKTNHIETPRMAVLSLPLRVGIAMLPPAKSNNNYTASNAPSLAQQTFLLQKVAAEFRALPYVKSIEVIPSVYLRPEGSFENLDQLKTMYGVDVIALVSYDQVQFTDTSLFSLAYWTIVGAYVVQGEKNDTQTMIDAVVYDIASRRMLFRAPGISRIKAHAAPIDLNAELREDSRKGLETATTEMIKNLNVELSTFKERIKTEPEEFKIEYKPGFSVGLGGSTTVWFPLALAVLALPAYYTRRKRA